MKKFKLKMDGECLHLEFKDGISSTDLESLISQYFNKHDIAVEEYITLNKS